MNTMASDNFELLQESAQPEERKLCSHLQKVFTTHPCLYGFMFIAIFILDLAQICNDWLLIREIIFLRQGLVYGPLSPTIVMVLVVASGVGSLAMGFEMFNVSRDVCTGRPWGDLELVSAIVVWAEEIPTMTINFAISMCHNEPISMFQMSKTLIVALSVVIRIAVPLIKAYLSSKDARASDTRFRKSVYRVITSAGLCLTLCSIVAVVIFTHVIATDERKFQFRVPSEIWSSQFAHDTYFTDVGIYFHHSELNEPVKDQYWVKLTEINDFEKIHNMYAKISYVRRNNKINTLMIASYTDSEELFNECYKYQEETNQYVFTDCVADFIPASGETLIFRFAFEEPQQYLILGDIVYSVRYKKSNICYNPTVNGTNIYHNATEEEDLELLGRLVYIKPMTVLQESHRLIDRTHTIDDMADHLPYKIDQEILEGEEIWKTGMYGCECTGKSGPSYQSDMTLSC